MRSPRRRKTDSRDHLRARSDSADMNSNMGVKQTLIGCGLWKGKPDLDRDGEIPHASGMISLSHGGYI